jgi:type II secretory pathway component HofQ
MARLARVIAVGVPHHITRRGNARRFILQDEADRKVYLDLLRQSTELHGVSFGDKVSVTDGGRTLENTTSRSPVFGVHPIGHNSACQSATLRLLPQLTRS